MSTNAAHNKRVVNDRDLGEPNDRGYPHEDEVDTDETPVDYIAAALETTREKYPNIDLSYEENVVRAIRAFDTLNLHMWNREVCIKALLNLPPNVITAIEHLILQITSDTTTIKFTTTLINAARPPRTY